MNNFSYSEIIRDKTPAQILDEVNAFFGDSLSQKMVNYCEYHNIDPQELGDFLSEDKQFKKIIYFDAVKHNEIKDEYLKEQLNSTTDLEEW